MCFFSLSIIKGGYSGSNCHKFWKYSCTQCVLKVLRVNLQNNYHWCESLESYNIIFHLLLWSFKPSLPQNCIKAYKTYFVWGTRFLISIAKGWNFYSVFDSKKGSYNGPKYCSVFYNLLLKLTLKGNHYATSGKI